MALYHSEAFVLRTYKLGEADQIVVFFTPDYGKLRAVARRSRNMRRQTASYLQPLMLLRVILFGRPTQALHRINSVDIVHAFRPLREDFEAMRCGLYMTELVDVTTHEREPVPELFALLQQGLEQLTQAVHTHMLLRLFELRLLVALGYTPQLFWCARCARELPSQTTIFSPMLGGLLCPSCAVEVHQTLTVHPATLAYLRLLIASEAEPSLPLPDDPVVHQELEQVLHAHLTARLGRELKSYAFLHL